MIPADDPVQRLVFSLYLEVFGLGLSLIFLHSDVRRPIRRFATKPYGAPAVPGHTSVVASVVVSVLASVLGSVHAAVHVFSSAMLPYI